MLFLSEQYAAATTDVERSAADPAVFFGWYLGRATACLCHYQVLQITLLEDIFLKMLLLLHKDAPIKFLSLRFLHQQLQIVV